MPILGGLQTKAQGPQVGTLFYGGKICQMQGRSQPYELAGLGRRGYYRATDARNSRRVEALQSDDKDFLPIAPKANQLIFMRWSFESMLPLQALRINIRADCAEELCHSFPLTMAHHLPCLMDNRVLARTLL